MEVESEQVYVYRTLQDQYKSCGTVPDINFTKIEVNYNMSIGEKTCIFLYDGIFSKSVNIDEANEYKTSINIS